MYGSCPEGAACLGADDCTPADALRQWFRRHHGAGLSVASAGEAVICTDTAGRIHYLNSVCTDLTGYKPEQLVGWFFASRFFVVDEGAGRSSHDPLSACLASGAMELTGNDDVLVAQGGRRIPLAGTASPLRGPSNELLGAIFIFRDATPTRRLMRGIFSQDDSARRWQGADEPALV
ncbi:MAG: PAS domain-containing protein [Pseudomonadota bacterium]|nr:PAS domain-containing protein [Pseudomonadota bacterium]